MVPTAAVWRSLMDRRSTDEEYTMDCCLVAVQRRADVTSTRCGRRLPLKTAAVFSVLLRFVRYFFALPLLPLITLPGEDSAVLQKVVPPPSFFFFFFSREPFAVTLTECSPGSLASKSLSLSFGATSEQNKEKNRAGSFRAGTRLRRFAASR